MDDESVQLVDLCRAGDADATRRVYERYVERLIVLARRRLSRRLSRRVDAEDVVQSAYRSFFIRVRRGEYAIRRSGELWRLLAGITLHKLLGQVEHHTAARRNVQREAAESERSRALVQLAAAEPSAEHVVALADELSRLLAAMTPLEREVFELRLREFTIEEIADRTGRSERTVRRMLAALKRMLADRFDGIVNE